ncbi:EF-hand domain-containing protein [Nonomuraea sp. NPDC050547]|uniref:EF-hand domain-containing protein n=1 Tax=unclassified Nonomuraea TaxID=2593643 RepID=UPI00379EB15B
MDNDFFQRKVQARLAGFDHDKDGVITQADVDTVTERAMGAYGLAATSPQAKALKAAAGTFWRQVAANADGDRDGKINQDEFFLAAAGFQQAVQPWVRALVSAADTDDDGWLTDREYRSLLQALGADATTLDQAAQHTASDGSIAVANVQKTALELFADHKPYAPATWSFGTF